VPPRRPTSEDLPTNLGTFGVPAGWDPLGTDALEMWRQRTSTPVVGAMVRSDPSPTSIIDVTPLALGWSKIPGTSCARPLISAR
jgi:hypothetical protein